ncbi:MAG: hypothetical protein GKR77_01320 [Legionellales bacterium]|nr:hypothetical protein [Legionellales bacterium]
MDEIFDSRNDGTASRSTDTVYIRGETIVSTASALSTFPRAFIAQETLEDTEKQTVQQYLKTIDQIKTSWKGALSTLNQTVSKEEQQWQLCLNQIIVEKAQQLGQSLQNSSIDLQQIQQQALRSLQQNITQESISLWFQTLSLFEQEKLNPLVQKVSELLQQMEQKCQRQLQKIEQKESISTTDIDHFLSAQQQDINTCQEELESSWQNTVQTFSKECQAKANLLLKNYTDNLQLALTQERLADEIQRLQASHSTQPISQPPNNTYQKTTSSSQPPTPADSDKENKSDNFADTLNSHPQKESTINPEADSQQKPASKQPVLTLDTTDLHRSWQPEQEPSPKSSPLAKRQSMLSPQQLKYFQRIRPAQNTTHKVVPQTPKKSLESYHPKPAKTIKEVIAEVEKIIQLLNLIKQRRTRHPDIDCLDVTKVIFPQEGSPRLLNSGVDLTEEHSRPMICFISDSAPETSQAHAKAELNLIDDFIVEIFSHRSQFDQQYQPAISQMIQLSQSTKYNSNTKSSPTSLDDLIKGFTQSIKDLKKPSSATHTQGMATKSSSFFPSISSLMSRLTTLTLSVTDSDHSKPTPTF